MGCNIDYFFDFHNINELIISLHTCHKVAFLLSSTHNSGRKYVSNKSQIIEIRRLI